ncbi:MAG: DUF3301 domain-containing protein [Gammaproteobacteria bacterium]|nr:DUF3301 domain-containing protein [Gammaproteobacteria bacterium]MBT7306567.1 DUF3301 domain-containing protein [Gammaproteobacteria bacterium]
MRELIDNLLLAGIPIAAVLFWFSSMRARERAVTVCRLTCKSYGAQLLDQTVSLYRIRLRRNSRGRLQFYRSYRFDYSYDGLQRMQGSLSMLGPYSDLIHLDPPDHPEENLTTQTDGIHLQ